MSDKTPKLRLVVSPERERAGERGGARAEAERAAGAPAGGPLHGPSDDDAFDAPFTEDELREAEATRALLEAGDEPISSSLRAAFEPAQFSEADHEALLSRVLGDPLAAPTRVEQATAERLRQRLDPGEAARAPAAAAPSGAGEAAERGAELAVALRAAWRPPVLAPLRNEALIARALAGTRRRGRGRELVAAAVGLLALAAGVALVFRQVGHPGHGGPSAPTAEGAPATAMIAPRSTMDLFDAATPFPRSGQESARIDRIAASRGSDLRQNRYAQWGVR